MRIRNTLFLFIVPTVLLIISIAIRVVDNNEKTALQTIQENLERISSEQKSDLNDFVDQFTIYSNPFDIYSDTRFLKRVFVNDQLVYWSDDHALFEELPSASDSLFIHNTDQGVFLVQKYGLNNGAANVVIFSVYELFTRPPIFNQYLSDNYSNEVFGQYDIRFVWHKDFNITIGDDHLFIKIRNSSGYWLDGIILIETIICFAFLFVLLFVRRGESLVNKKLKIFLFLVLCRIGLWFLTTYFLQLQLFDPIHYTSNIGSSLGDLLLNSCLVLCLFALWSDEIFKFWPKQELLASVLCIVSIHFISYVLFKASQDLQKNSLILLDINDSLNLDSIRVFALMLLILWGYIFLQVFTFLIRIFRNCNINKWQVFFLYYVLLTAFSFLTGEKEAVIFIVVSLVWWGSCWLPLKFDPRNLDYRGFLYITLLICLVAGVYSLIVYKHAEKSDLLSKRRFSNLVLIRNDFWGEFLLDEKIEQISKDPFIRTRLSNPYLNHNSLEETIHRQYLGTYFEKYDVDVVLFDALGISLDGQGSRYDEIQNKYAIEEYETDYSRIYFVEDKQEHLRDRYYCFVPIVSFDRVVGNVVLMLTLKKYVFKSVFPELLVSSDYSNFNSTGYDYAVFKGGKLLYKQGRFDFQSVINYPVLQRENLYDRGIEIGHNHFLGIQSLDGYTYVIVSGAYPVKRILANFSFYYLLLLFAFALIFSIAQLFTPKIEFNLSTKIQLYLGLSFVVPMCIVSIALLNTLNLSYKEEIDKNYTQKAYAGAEYLNEWSESFVSNELNRSELANILGRVSELLQADVNFYDNQGMLVSSSEMEIFDLGLLGHQIYPEAYNSIIYSNAETKIYSRSIGELSFRTAYVSIRSFENGALLGILSIPYFDSRSHLIDQQVEIFGDLISIFTFIFIISILVGNVVIGKLIRPLKLITERLKTTDLKQQNAPLEYESRDEIGLLINEYNQMIEKLEASKQALAESQKESAWKEIARQVAHEIKNPLTPMRLKIQQMMRHMESGSKEYRTLNSLIEQIDALSSIADSFSAFAKMPAPKNTKFDVIGVLLATIDVHQREGVSILINHTEPVMINADAKIFNGIFNNILLNAIQASGDDATIKIDIELRPKKVVIAIADQGGGIAEENQHKIFTPYFTTKSTGSGIGLAVAKKGIESAGGSIWFETELEVGTTFFIAMPIAP